MEPTKAVERTNYQKHLAGLNYDRLCCPQPADSGLALWLAIRSWDSDSHSGVMDLGVGGENHFSSLGQVSLPSL